MGNQYTLSIKNGPDAGKTFILDKNELMLGREATNDLVVNDPEVSRKHAVLRKIGSQYLIEDLGSTNGTFLLGNRISMPMMLQNGDEIMIGERVVLRYEIVQPDIDATMVSPRREYSTEAKPEGVQVPTSAAAEEKPYAAPFIPSQPVVSQQAQQPLPVSPIPAQPVQNVVQAAPAPVQPVRSPIEAKPAPVQHAAVVPPVPPSQSAPAYAGKTPAQPAKSKKRSGILTILLIILAVVLVFCVIPWIIIDITNSYCLFLPGVFNAIQPGVCP